MNYKSMHLAPMDGTPILGYRMTDRGHEWNVVSFEKGAWWSMWHGIGGGALKWTPLCWQPLEIPEKDFTKGCEKCS
jgi:hypothetical protein